MSAAARRVRVGSPINPQRTASSLSDLDTDQWHVVARQPLTIDRLSWNFGLPESDMAAYRGGVMLGAISTCQGRDDTGTPVLFARRGHNSEWWKSRKDRCGGRGNA